MNLQQTEGWKAVSGVQLGVFILAIGAFFSITFVQIRKGLRIKSILTFFILMVIFNGIKIAGGIVGLVFLGNKKFNESLFIGTYICDSISLGFITRAVSSLARGIVAFKIDDPQDVNNHREIDSDNDSNRSAGGFRKGPEDEESATRYVSKDFSLNPGNDILKEVKDLKNVPFRILTLVLIAAVVTNVIGTSQLDSNDSSSNSSEQALIKASAVLFVVGVVGLIAILTYISVTARHCAFISQLLIAALVILIIRCVYSLISAFHGIDFNSPSKYMLMVGLPKYYGCLALFPEIVADIILLVAYYKW
ncbi:hypothetical protein I9W82_004659 [Candida metapsilosis]|uniref:DUF7702 domain-containing protein n=1 Tax=Candida metapsilosis TaxID=273372 RepID=A0A8H7ZBS0_9ASCO|nr:hypothetical protein I9W82_004659 [Candida metapsilosis]